MYILFHMTLRPWPHKCSQAVIRQKNRKEKCCSYPLFFFLPNVCCFFYVNDGIHNKIPLCLTWSQSATECDWRVTSQEAWTFAQPTFGYPFWWWHTWRCLSFKTIFLNLDVISGLELKLCSKSQGKSNTCRPTATSNVRCRESICKEGFSHIVGPKPSWDINVYPWVSYFTRVNI